MYPSQGTMISVLKDGLVLCSPCVISSTSEEFTKITFLTPVSATDGEARIVVEHAYLPAEKFTFDFTYDTSGIGEFSTDKTLVNLNGGETFSFTKTSAISCDSMVVELTLARNACSEGAHRKG